MSMILRYVRYVRRLNSVGKGVVLNQRLIQATGVKLGFHQASSFNLNSVKGYATNAEVNPRTLSLGYSAPLQNFETHLKRGGRVSISDIEKVLLELRSGRSLMSLDALLLIRSCGRLLIEAGNQESIELVLKIWNLCKEYNVPMDVSHYNALLSVYLEKDHVFSPSNFVSNMIENSIKPNRVTYQKLIEAYCQQGDVAGATKILEIMREENLPLCENVFNSLITGHLLADDVQSAVGILETMTNAGINPSENTYEALLCGYGKHGDIDTIKETLNKLKNSETVMFDTQLLNVIYSLVANKHIAAAEELIDTYLGEIISDNDTCRVLVKLLHINEVALAQKILRVTSKDPVRQQIRTLLFVRAAVRSKVLSGEDLVQICNQFEVEGNYNRVYETALYHSLSSEADPAVTMTLLKAWRENGGDIRVHYFWPLLRSEMKKNGENGLMTVLKTMVEDFKLSPCFETLRDYVLPNIYGTWEKVIDKLQVYNISKQTICYAVVDRMLLQKKTKNAGYFISLFPIKYPKEIFLEHLTDTLTIRDDLNTFLRVLRLLDQEPLDTSNDNTSIELIDVAMLKVMNIIPIYRPSVVIKFLQELMTSGLSMSPAVGDQVRIYLNKNVTPEIDDMIKKITSGTLVPVPSTKFISYDGEQSPEHSQSIGTATLRRKFADELNNRNVENVTAILKEMNDAEYVSAPVIAQAIDLFCESNHLEAAEACINKIKNIESIKLDNMKIIRYATLLINNNRFDDAIKFISEQPNADDTAKQVRRLRMYIHSMFELVVKSQNVENLQRLFDVLHSKDFIAIDNYSLGPLIKIHILRGDLEKALEQFEQACMKHKCTPYKNVLARSLIENEDANSLQKMTDLCTEIHGETNSLCDLALTFLECDRVSQAQKIIETSGIPIHNSKISTFITRVVEQGELKHLDNFVKITKRVTRMDRGHLFNSLLMVYDNMNDWKKGLALWTQMQEDDVQPPKVFLKTLRDLLKRNGENVPFVYTDVSLNKSLPIPLRKLREEENVRFNEAISRRDYNLAERVILSTTVNRYEAIKQYGKIITCLIYENDVDNALQFTKALINKYSQMRRTDFNVIASKLIELGRIQDFEELGEIMEESVKQSVLYDKFRSIISIKTDGLKNFLENVKVKLMPFSTTDPRSIERFMHFGAMVNGLIEDPSCETRFIEFANDMLQRGLNRPIQVLWNYYFITNSPQAELFWTKYMSNIHSPLIRPIIEFAKNNKDSRLIERLMKLVEQNPHITNNSQSRTISGLIDVYNIIGRFDDSLRKLEEFTQRYPINMISLKTLQELKAGLEQSGKTFPYSINTDATSDIDETEIICTAKL